MKKTIYIHIGSPKTGSTAIQSFFSLNQDVLLKHNIFYPLVGRSLSGPFGQVFINGYIFIRRLIVANGSMKIIAHINSLSLYKLFNDFDDSGCSCMLISEEAFFFGSDGELARIIDSIDKVKYDIKILVYLKNICEYATGLWKEDVKSGIWEQDVEFNPDSTADLEASVRLKVSCYLNSLAMLKSLGEKIGRNKIIVRTFEKDRWKNKDFIDDFLSLLGIDRTDTFKKIEGNVNAGVSREMVEKFRYMNRYLGIRIEPWFKLHQKIPSDKISQKLVDSMPDNLIKEITDICYPAEQEIAKLFLGRDELFIHKYHKIYGVQRNKFEDLDQETKAELNFLILLALKKYSSNYQNDFKKFDRKHTLLSLKIIIKKIIPFITKNKVQLFIYKAIFPYRLSKKLLFQLVNLLYRMK